MGLLDIFRHEQKGLPSLGLDEWLSYFSYNGQMYAPLNQTLPGSKTEEIVPNFQGLTHGAYKRSSIVFACMMVRMLHFSEARFSYRQLRGGRPGKLFGNADLTILEQPWPGGTTGDLLSKMLVFADLAGNAFVIRSGDYLKLLRPDWVTIVSGSRSRGEADVWDPDSELVGYIYHPGGYNSSKDPVVYRPEEVAHFAPIPDPDAEYRGMSWLTPLIADIMGDQAATTHKLKFFENGASPNIVVSLPISDQEKFDVWTKLFEEKYAGASNAYKTMFLAAGADATVVGSDFKQMDFKQTVGVSETRIASAAGVPPVVVGLSEGLQGSSLNAGNYSAARRRFADGTMRPLWRNVAGSLARLINVPADAQLWYDTRDIAFLREDEEIEARIVSEQAAAMRQLIDGGFEPSSVIDAVTSGDLARLAHSGMMSVQLQPAGAAEPSANGAADTHVPAITA